MKQKPPRIKYKKRESESQMATLAIPKKHPYVLKKSCAGTFEKNESTKQEIEQMKYRADLFARYNLKNRDNVTCFLRLHS